MKEITEEQISNYVRKTYPDTPYLQYVASAGIIWAIKEMPGHPDPTTKETTDKAMFWLNYGNTGNSSKTIWNCLMGNKKFAIDIPWDPGDFGRCYGLLEMVPEWKLRLDEVAKLDPTWARLIAKWDKLVDYLEDMRKIDRPNGMYEFMQTLINPPKI